mmetsp:Transcript_38322/g.92083  ORF Transcript_38322/g.92083 Transcript_38322/m.92083 type:complete len:323 (-) Transcript_38322:201-1169(-)
MASPSCAAFAASRVVAAAASGAGSNGPTRKNVTRKAVNAAKGAARSTTRLNASSPAAKGAKKAQTSTAGGVATAMTEAENAVALKNNAVATQRAQLARAREIMTIDPTEGHNALELLASVESVAVQFSVHYETKVGEDLFVVGSHRALGNWAQADAFPLTWTEGSYWKGVADLPAGGAFFYKYIVRRPDGSYRWQEGANNLVMTPDVWDVPDGGTFLLDDNFAGLSKQANNALAIRLISTEKEKVTLKIETKKAKEMTKAALSELLIAREELQKANEKLAMYEENAQTVISKVKNGIFPKGGKKEKATTGDEEQPTAAETSR